MVYLDLLRLSCTIRIVTISVPNNGFTEVYSRNINCRQRLIHYVEDLRKPYHVLYYTYLDIVTAVLPLIHMWNVDITSVLSLAMFCGSTLTLYFHC